MKRVGILTGISYASGLDYYRGINAGIGDDKKYSFTTVSHSSKIVLVSLDLDEYATRLARGARRGNYNGAIRWITEQIDPLADYSDFLVIASNTAHVASERIREVHPDLPLLHIADVTASAIKDEGLTTVGLLGTFHTMTGSFIVDRIRAHGIDVIVQGIAKCSKRYIL